MALLCRDYSTFDSLMALPHDGKFQEQYKELERIKKDELGIKKKSPLVAAGMSAILPGLGKVYAGKPFQGLVALSANAILAAQAFEAYQHNGYKDYRFIGFAGLFAIFYAGNIWGSALSVKMASIEYEETKHQTILLMLRIPLEQLLPPGSARP